MKLAGNLNETAYVRQKLTFSRKMRLNLIIIANDEEIVKNRHLSCESKVSRYHND